uniref:G-protein coupled receptors family 3 profile domain-containing protein n=1 Tax=Xenopus tropicalis TaxID=8364 RepID=A0A6I8R0P3_XENTR
LIPSRSFTPLYYQSMQAFIFAVEEINSDPELLPNVTLGFRIFDTCTTLRRAAQGALWMLSQGQEITPNYYCHQEAPLAGIIGDSSTEVIPLYHYNFFFYPILVLHFGWTWVGLLANDDDYGQFGLQIVKQELMNAGVCVAFSENILTGQPDRNAPHLVQVIRESTTKVVVVIASDSDFVIVVEELFRKNVTGNIWVASEAWAASTLLSQQRFQAVLVGAVGFAIHSRQMPTFTKYLHTLMSSKYPNDSFIGEFWEQTFSCKWLSQKELIRGATTPLCTGNEKLESILPIEDQRVSFNVYTAVYAIAWALHNLLHCKPGMGPLYHAICANITSFLPWHLLYHMKNVYFKAKDGREVFFDAEGNPPAVYDIVNWRLDATGGTNEHSPQSPPNWPSGWVPLSKCSPSCPPGFHKVIVPEKPQCCYVCSRCPLGQISSQTDAAECHPCSWDTWPNLQQDRCLPRPTEFLSYGDPLGYSLAAISISSTLAPLVVLRIFICNNKTPIVRANNYSLSCLLLLSLFLCFLCSLGFIGYPQPEKCLLRQVAFGMVFALCISCVLAKTITVVIAFNATKPGSRLRKWTGVKVSYNLLVFCVFIQLCVCTVWLTLSPPFHELDTDTQPGIIIANCNEGSPAAFWCMLGYLGLLATISFIVAFLARRLPDSFNEAKYITFSMLAFLSVWVSFIPAYLSARGMYTVAMEVFAILSSSWALLGCIFVPKCFIVIFRPTKNSKEQVLGRVRGNSGGMVLSGFFVIMLKC